MPSGSRGTLRPSFAIPSPSERSEGAGKAGWPLHPGPPRQKNCAKARDHRYRRKHSGLPCAMVYGLLRTLPGETRLCCHRRQRDAKHHRQLSTCIRAPGPHDFAVRLCVARLRHIRVHRIPAPRFVTIAIRPSCRGGMGATIHLILDSEKAKYFRRPRLTAICNGRSSGKSDARPQL